MYRDETTEHEDHTLRDDPRSMDTVMQWPPARSRAAHLSTEVPS